MNNVVRYANPDDDFELREEMIPMRDGAMLHTLILSPKLRAGPMPILLQRTPYDSRKRLRAKSRTALHSVLGISHAELPGYIFAFQDIRGRHGSTGDFEINRPPRGKFNTTDTDETTDAWDAIAWLVENVEGNNGRAAIYGTSYEGWTTLMALLDPHPALKAAIPVNPMVDGWMGDDWFHNGAFRISYAFEYVYAMESNQSDWTAFAYSQRDTYAWWLKSGSARQVGERYLDGKRHLFWKRLLDNPAYSDYWKDTALDRVLQQSTAPLIPTMHVHSWFDQEDIYGAPAAYQAMLARDPSRSHNFFVAGPWFHGQNWSVGDRLGPVAWNADAARHWREDQLDPFLRHYLMDGPAHDLAPATVFNTGTRRWERHRQWPPTTGSESRAVHLAVDGSLSFEPPTAAAGVGQAYVSDPSKPVPYTPRPTPAISTDEGSAAPWRIWLTGDQRFVDGRPDVLTFVSPPLDEQLTVRGDVTAVLFAETTGTDADWVVKLIDAFPDLDAADPDLSGYQLMISADILRGRYRRHLDAPEAVAPNETVEYVIRLPQVNHTFRHGHRIMVQIQSTWFPLYDRNPQRFVPSIMSAGEADYQSAVHRIHTNASHPSRVEFSVAARGDGTAD